MGPSDLTGGVGGLTTAGEAGLGDVTPGGAATGNAGGRAGTPGFGAGGGAGAVPGAAPDT
jgi:hypothetical protein